MTGIAEFAAEVGAKGPVVAVGGRTQWEIGGLPAAGAREVRPPAGVVSHEPAEMTVRCGAGTAVADLDAALGAHGQCVALPDWPGATVGGVLAVGRSGIRRLGYGPVRDAVLEVRYVSAEGRVVKAGGPTVKNVSGFDLCRLLVGSLGTLGLLAEIVLRTRPLPQVSRWFEGNADPTEVWRALYRPASILWDGATTWVLLEGHRDDVAAQAEVGGLSESAGPPPLPPHRWSVAPGTPIDADPGSFVAQVGAGVVHRHDPPPTRSVSPQVAELHARLKRAFDPSGRLNPGRDVLAA